LAYDRGLTRDADFTDALADVLFAFEPPHVATGAITRAITREIVRWATTQDWAVRTEARVELGVRGESVPVLGFVDVLVMRGHGLPDVAIEIDSTDKTWSVVKLQHAALAGMHAIWVRWGDDAWAGVYDEVDVIQLRTLRKVGHRRALDQLPVWETLPNRP
jgi:hypothetical protein